MLQVLHLIPGLRSGGVESLLPELARGLREHGFDSHVVSMTGRGAAAVRLEESGVEVSTLGMRPGLPDPRGLALLLRLLRARRPALLQTWLYHADLLGSVAARLLRLPLVWGVHATSLVGLKPTMRLTARVCRALASFAPRRIIYCSPEAERAHRRWGYPGARGRVVPNGVATELFVPDATARSALRVELGLAPDTPLVGLVARYEARKDHKTFFRAAALIAREMPGVRFVLCGRGVSPTTPALRRLSNAGPLRGRVFLLGERHDMPRLQASLDVATVSSWSEASPLALAEAMSCEVPCVTTDVGDCGAMLGDTGRVVPPRSPEQLAGAWRELLQLDSAGRRRLGRRARARVMEQMSLTRTVAGYAAVYREVVGVLG